MDITALSGPAAWAALFSPLGYVFGRTISALVGEMACYEILAALMIFAVGIAWYLLYRVRLSRAPRRR